jgi:hypothetical protein
MGREKIFLSTLSRFLSSLFLPLFTKKPT